MIEAMSASQCPRSAHSAFVAFPVVSPTGVVVVMVTLEAVKASWKVMSVGPQPETTEASLQEPRWEIVSMTSYRCWRGIDASNHEFVG